MLELLRRLLVRPVLLTELILASCFANILALAAPLFVIQVLNRYVAHGVGETLMTLTIGAVIAVVLEFAFRQVRNRLARGVSVRPDEQITLAGFGILTHGRAGSLERLPPGQQREIMTGIDNIRNAYSATNIATVLDLPFALLFLGVLFLLAPTLGMIAAVFTVAALLFGMMMMVAIRAPTRQLIDEQRKSGLLVGAAIAERDTVRAFNAGGYLGRAWNARIRVTQDLFRRIIARQGLLASFSQSITAFMSITTIAVGGILVVRGDLDIGALIGANILAARALQPISRYAQLGEVFLKAKQSATLLREFIKLPREAETGSAKREYQGSVELRDIGFMYPGATGPLFESLSVSIPAGSVCVVTGANGAGKSTLARLLLGVIEPNRGQILVDGLELRQVLPEWWRKQVAYLPQEPGFLNASIQENLTVNAPELEIAHLNLFVDATGLRNFLDEAPQGFDTPIVDNGRRLAVGIRRRLALARALTTRGRLIVLDEPTESLDAAGCQVVSSILSDLHRAGHTIIAFSHDPNFIKDAAIVIDLNVKPVPDVRVQTQGQAANQFASANEELTQADITPMEELTT